MSSVDSTLHPSIINFPSSVSPSLSHLEQSDPSKWVQSPIAFNSIDRMHVQRKENIRSSACKLSFRSKFLIYLIPLVKHAILLILRLYLHDVFERRLESFIESYNNLLSLEVRVSTWEPRGVSQRVVFSSPVVSFVGS